MYDPIVVARFESKIDKKPGYGPWRDCWMFTGFRDPAGYGVFRVPFGSRQANRVAWQIEHGRRLARNEFACHRCDNPGCVRPDHLFAGSAKDNTDDSIKKRRFVYVAPKQKQLFCRRGHAMIDENLIVDRDGKRHCRTCRQAFDRIRACERRKKK